MKHFRYFIVHKPYNVLCQFSPLLGKKTLKDIAPTLPPDVYPVGRLDEDSEGLIILTNDVKLQHQVANPAFKQPKTYLVQVDGEITDEAIEQLKKGVTISTDSKPYTTLPCIVKKLDVNIPERNPPIRFRKNIPTRWIEIILTEGKNRQIRKMTAKVGFPTLRIIRTNIGDIALHDLAPGEYKELTQREVYQKLRIT